MNIAHELKKLTAIESSGRFQYGCTEFVLDVPATASNPANKHLDGKPLKRLTGIDAKGNIAVVWSHDCKAVQSTYEAIAEMVEEVGIPEKIVTKNIKKRKKK